ncbi:VSP with INR [Giardia lamblia P15]|uniref:VSP with INR n=1 Tax=Giardia intestinalis (strain P15) TaxID=658858 RepID=E1EWJ7_GIAIA|nr:VSP with INR [Giardia lamblia P15]
MFAKLIFISLILQLTEATRPAGRTRSEGECTSLGAAGCATCSTGDSGETCLTCTDPEKFIAANKKSCEDACNTSGGEVVDSAAVGPDGSPIKACKCDTEKGYQLQGDACVQAPPDGACSTLKPAGCATCSTGDSGETCLTCTDPEKFIAANKKSCEDACNTSGGEVVDSAAVGPDGSPIKACKCDTEKGYQLQGDACVKTQPSACKTENCQECTNKGAADEVCTKCNPTHYLTPTNQCVSDCTTIKGYYGDTDGKCKACNPECAECVGAANNQCSACPAGKSLAYSNSMYPNNGGTCGDACTVDKNGCKVCGAKIGGTDYCSQCSDATQAPLNGNCTANTRAAFCTKMGTGACTQCADGYFLKDGGCYQTDRQPGKQVCSSAQGGNGKCRTCANGLAASDGNCGECHPTCATCSAAGAAEKCRTCATGYYKENADSSADGTCKRCSEKIPGCKQCTSSSAGSVVCLESEAGTGGSTNKSGLSTGAIAGIAVAVIIVVGGLVGFLCWWFLCRGKA